VDGSGFDELARSLATSRRGAVRVILGGAMAGMATLIVGGDAGAKPKGFQRLGKPCDHGQPCGEYTLCRNGFCEPTKCLIGGVLYDDRVVNRDNPCERCVAVEHNDAWRRWSDVPNGHTCPPNASGDPCKSTFIATCQDGVCVTEPLADGSDCGDGQVCCGGDCCPSGLGCTAGACHQPEDDDDDDDVPPCPGGNCDPGGGCTGADCPSECTIDGHTYADGTINHDRDCEWCDVDVSTTAWTLRPDNAGCGPDFNRFCCNGVCCVIEKVCCGEVGTCAFSCGSDGG
jgi:hypothetical protein